MKHALGCAILLAMCSSSGVMAQGNLTPPGPPARDMKTLQQVEPRIPISGVPFHITSPGSYYLASNLTCTVTNDHGIEVSANHVTIDLNGFTLAGPGTTSQSGIYQSTNYHSLAIINGHVTQWRRMGSYGGIMAFGMNNRVEGVQASSNLLGVLVGPNGIIAHCSAVGNLNAGLVGRTGCSISYCAAQNNSLGIYVEDGCSIVHCAALTNLYVGITLEDHGALSDCTASFNGADGVSAGADTTITGGSFCHNGANGLQVSDGAMISKCTASHNVGDGISSDAAVITDCVATYNEGDGIQVSNSSIIRGNLCNANGYLSASGSGIYIMGGSRNRIADNNLISNDRGLWVAGAGNIIFCNTAGGNTTNYVIFANNKVGPIVSAPNSGAISGSTGGAGLGSTDPWANFSY